MISILSRDTNLEIGITFGSAGGAENHPHARGTSKYCCLGRSHVVTVQARYWKRLEHVKLYQLHCKYQIRQINTINTVTGKAIL